MKSYSILMRNKLLRLIEEFEKNKMQFVARPGYDFIRNRKMGFKSTIMAMLSMGGGSLQRILEDYYENDQSIVSTSAFVQQRDKISVTCFMELFKRFSNIKRGLKKFRGYRLLAADGSRINTPYNPACPITHEVQETGRGFNTLHLNTIYDIKNRFYVDALVSPMTEYNENGALIDMVDNLKINNKVILVADRGYESYNLFANLKEKGWNYVIRVKDIDSNGIVGSLETPDTTEFDIDYSFILTNKQTNYIKENKDIFKFLPSTSVFDFLNQTSRFYKMTFRVVRVKLYEDNYETIITNLPRSQFDISDLKEIYDQRWGIEVSYKHLKYATGLVNLHSKKVDNIYKEIYAKLLIYNFTELIISKSISTSTQTLQKTKYIYEPDISIIAYQCMKMFRLSRLKNPPNIEACIKRNTHPVRPDRVFTRNVKTQSYVSFNLRVT